MPPLTMKLVTLELMESFVLKHSTHITCADVKLTEIREITESRKYFFIQVKLASKAKEVFDFAKDVFGE